MDKVIKVIKSMKCTIVFAVVFIVVFIIDKLVGGSLTKWGSASNDLFVNKEFWRLITSTYLHANLLHLLANVAGLLLIGYTVENKLGVKGFLLIFLLSDFVTNCIQWLMPDINSTGAVGASCGIFGLLGAFAIIMCNDMKYGMKEFGNVFGIIRGLGIAAYSTFTNTSAFNLLGHLLGLACGIQIMSVYLSIIFYINNKRDSTKIKAAEVV